MENRNMVHKTITHIGCPKEWDIADDYSSHRPLLWLGCENTGGVIVEAGMRFGSTKLLENLNYKRPVGHYDNNKDWIRDLKYAAQSATFVIDWLDNDLFPCIIGLLFIDCAPADIRKELIKKHQDRADVLVIHDTEPSAEYVYGMEPILSTFKYRLDFRPDGFPHTTAVSNFINVTEWVK